MLEVHVAGDRTKDEKTNVERYARLGIQEYVSFDRPRLRLACYRLPAGGPGAPARAYERVVPQAGRFASAVLGLDLGLEGSRLRFFSGNAPLEDADEMRARLESRLENAIAAREEAERFAGELAAKLAHRDVERRLAEALAEIERLKKGPS